MEFTPDFNRIGRLIAAWQNGVATSAEVTERLNWILDPSNFLPEAEQIAWNQDVDPRELRVMLKRIELKLNAIIEAQGIPLPAELNPTSCSDEVRELARKGNVIHAIKVHRDNTGASFIVAKKAVEDYLKHDT